MSGGLDSGVALALLAEAGRPVVGVTMRLWQVPGEEQSWEDSAASAREVCCRYGARYITVDFRERFSAEVVTPFASEYASARTPNPCVRCNQRIKSVLCWTQSGNTVAGCSPRATMRGLRRQMTAIGYCGALTVAKINRTFCIC
jgi:tRNA U34 2-thiouridine synthase MnmA/TrmU